VVVQLLHGNVTVRDTHVAEKPYARVLAEPVVGDRDALYFLVIGRNSVPNEAVWSREPFEEIDVDLMLLLLDESLDGVKASRSGTDDCDAERSLFAADGVCGHVGQRARARETRETSEPERRTTRRSESDLQGRTQTPKESRPVLHSNVQVSFTGANEEQSS
jgi:hypothetical protein